MWQRDWKLRVFVMQVENEELKHILWTSVLFYRSPDVETTACVLLSTRAIYFILEDTASSLTNQSSERFYSNLIFKYIQLFCSNAAQKLNCYMLFYLYFSSIVLCSSNILFANLFYLVLLYSIFCAVFFYYSIISIILFIYIYNAVQFFAYIFLYSFFSHHSL